MGAVFWAVSVNISLVPSFHLTCDSSWWACISQPRWILAQRFLGVGRSSSGLVSPSSFVLLDWRPLLHMPQAGKSPWPPERGSCGRFVFHLIRAPCSCWYCVLKHQQENKLQLLSPWPICLLALTHWPTLALWISARRTRSKLHSDPKEEDSSEENSQHSSEDSSASVDKDVSPCSEVYR